MTLNSWDTTAIYILGLLVAMIRLTRGQVKRVKVVLETACERLKSRFHLARCNRFTSISSATEYIVQLLSNSIINPTILSLTRLSLRNAQKPERP